jgi:hypothetical protein
VKDNEDWKNVRRERDFCERNIDGIFCIKGQRVENMWREIIRNFFLRIFSFKFL